MSRYYARGDRTPWKPSNGVSRRFSLQVAFSGAESGLASGIEPMAADEFPISPGEFGSLADALLARHRGTSHAVMTALSEGFVSAVLVPPIAPRARTALTPPRPPRHRAGGRVPGTRSSERGRPVRPAP
ncbi:DUF6086 family protein [Streptomyces fagopyri]|uniref:DUF6086 family protein n=1 Tax=Streptomyces fagopyri TaxID=2662397 RepID=UPI00381ECBDC